MGDSARRRDIAVDKVLDVQGTSCPLPRLVDGPRVLEPYLRHRDEPDGA
ncbi:MAG: hypothetical protein R3286_04040 [Gammaproteobacteria bacterium]|nr:hypothetical protein [Gammaproteobacteria bacterium]